MKFLLDFLITSLILQVKIMTNTNVCKIGRWFFTLSFIGIASCGNGVNEHKVEEYKTILTEQKICKEYGGSIGVQSSEHQKKFLFIPTGKEPIITIRSPQETYSASVMFTYGDGACLVEQYSGTGNLQIATQVWEAYHPPSQVSKIWNFITSFFKQPAPRHSVDNNKPENIK